MEIPTGLLERYKPREIQTGAPRNEREEMTQKFLDTLNTRRVAEGFKPYTYARMATLLQGIPTGDLFAFYRQCEGARSFSRMFHWALKPKV